MSPFKKPYTATQSPVNVPKRFWLALSSTTLALFHYHHAEYGTDIKTHVTKQVKNYPYDDGEPRPTEAALVDALNLVEKAAMRVTVSQPAVSIFYGELELSWCNGNRTVSLLSKGGAAGMRIHQHEVRPGDAGWHNYISDVTIETFIDSLQWLDAFGVERSYSKESEMLTA
jgi:hypothetical protein